MLQQDVPFKVLSEGRLIYVKEAFRKIFALHGAVEATTPELFSKNALALKNVNERVVAPGEALVLAKNGAVYGLRYDLRRHFCRSLARHAGEHWDYEQAASTGTGSGSGGYDVEAGSFAGYAGQQAALKRFEINHVWREAPAERGSLPIEMVR